jgi:hypothetical protein
MLDVSCGVSGFGDGLLEKTYIKINVIFAPTFLGQPHKGHWVLIVMKKEDKLIVKTSSKGTCKTSMKDYSKHSYSKLMKLTKWEDPKLVKRKPILRCVLQTRAIDGVWQFEYVVLDCKGPQCGPLMFKAFHEEMTRLIGGAGGGPMATKLSPSAESFADGEERLAALHHMGVIIKEIIERSDVSLDKTPDGALALGLLGLSLGHLRTVAVDSATATHQPTSSVP